MVKSLNMVLFQRYMVGDCKIAYYNKGEYVRTLEHKSLQVDANTWRSISKKARLVLKSIHEMKYDDIAEVCDIMKCPKNKQHGFIVSSRGRIKLSRYVSITPNGVWANIDGIDDMHEKHIYRNVKLANQHLVYRGYDIDHMIEDGLAVTEKTKTQKI